MNFPNNILLRNVNYSWDVRQSSHAGASFNQGWIALRFRKWSQIIQELTSFGHCSCGLLPSYSSLNEKEKIWRVFHLTRVSMNPLRKILERVEMLREMRLYFLQFHSGRWRFENKFPRKYPNYELINIYWFNLVLRWRTFSSISTRYNDILPS